MDKEIKRPNTNIVIDASPKITKADLKKLIPYIAFIILGTALFALIVLLK